MRRILLILMTTVFLLAGVDAIAGESGLTTPNLKAKRDNLRRQARDAFEEGKWQETIDLSKECLDLYPSHVLGLNSEMAFWLGVSYLKLKNHLEARDYLSKIIDQLDPDYAEAYAYMGEIHANSQLKTQMKNDLLKAAELGYDVIAFAENNSEVEMQKLSKDAGFILEVLNKEKFEFKEPDHDPFHVPLKKPEKVEDTETRRVVERVKPYDINVQRKRVAEAWRLWNELRLLMDKVEKEQQEVPELMTLYEKIRAIISEKEQERFTDIDLQSQIRHLKANIEGQEVRDKLSWVRQKLFRKTGESILKNMLFHLKGGKYQDVYEWHQRLSAHVVNPQYVEFKKEAEWLTKQGAIIYDKARIRQKFTELELDISGTMILDTERQKFYSDKLRENEAKLNEMTSRMWADITQEDIEKVEKMINYYRERIRPHFVIINSRPYEKGHPIHGHDDLTLVDLDQDYAWFDYMGERVKKPLHKKMSATSRGNMGK